MPERASALATPATWATEPPTLAPKLSVGLRYRQRLRGRERASSGRAPGQRRALAQFAANAPRPGQEARRPRAGPSARGQQARAATGRSPGDLPLAPRPWDEKAQHDQVVLEQGQLVRRPGRYDCRRAPAPQPAEARAAQTGEVREGHAGAEARLEEAACLWRAGPWARRPGPSPFRERTCARSSEQPTTRNFNRRWPPAATRPLAPAVPSADDSQVQAARRISWLIAPAVFVVFFATYSFRLGIAPALMHDDFEYTYPSFSLAERGNFGSPLLGPGLNIENRTYNLIVYYYASVHAVLIRLFGDAAQSIPLANTLSLRAARGRGRVLLRCAARRSPAPRSSSACS